MRLFLAIALVVASAVPGQAITRYQSTKLTCQDIKAAIRQEGAVILRYPSTRNPSLTLYDRYVKNDNYCDSNQMIEQTSVPSADRAQCRVNHCVQAENRCEDDDSIFCNSFKRHRK